MMEALANQSLLVWLGVALVTGLASSVHCLGMCGSVVATMVVATPPQPTKALPAALALARIAVVDASASAGAEIRQSLMFNVGRLASYTLMGAIAGAVGAAGGEFLIGDIAVARVSLFIVAELVMLATGLYLMGVAALLQPLERAASHLWRHLSPLSRHLIPARTPRQAAMLGALWGWIPCGLVYAMLIGAMASGSATLGALVMLAFGLGTLPAMMAAGVLASTLKTRFRLPRVRLIAGAVVVGMAVLGLARVPGVTEQRAWAALGRMCASWVTVDVERESARARLP